jgi:TPP-dependent pyruvate/acetoin dehydrogenase alpha subunit
MASLWSAPILFVVENNRWAQSTPVQRQFAGDMIRRGEAFGMDAGQIESTDAEVLYNHFAQIIQKVRTTSRPHFEVIHTYRLCHHSKSDDMRPEEEIARFRADEPLPKLRKLLSEDTAADVEAHVWARVEQAFARAAVAPLPDPALLNGGRVSGGKR